MNTLHHNDWADVLWRRENSDPKCSSKTAVPLVAPVLLLEYGLPCAEAAEELQEPVMNPAPEKWTSMMRPHILTDK